MERAVEFIHSPHDGFWARSGHDGWSTIDLREAPIFLTRSFIWRQVESNPWSQQLEMLSLSQFQKWPLVR